MPSLPRPILFSGLGGLVGEARLVFFSLFLLSGETDSSGANVGPLKMALARDEKMEGG